MVFLKMVMVNLYGRLMFNVWILVGKSLVFMIVLIEVYLEMMIMLINISKKVC